MVLPMPDDPPVMIATLFSSCCKIYLLTFVIVAQQDVQEQSRHPHTLVAIIQLAGLGVHAMSVTHIPFLEAGGYGVEATFSSTISGWKLKISASRVSTVVRTQCV